MSSKFSRISFIPSDEMEEVINRKEASSIHIQSMFAEINWFNLCGLSFVVIFLYVLYRRYQNKKNRIILYGEQF